MTVSFPVAVLGIVGVLAAQSPLADIGPAPATVLQDQEDRPFRLDSLRGKAVLVSFVFTTCNGTCPTTTRTLVRVQNRLKAAGLKRGEVEFVSISLDPARDTPDVLRQYATTFGADLASWHFLTGPSARVDRLISSWGIWTKRNAAGVLDHSSRVFLIDPNGRQREIYNLDFLTPDSVLEDVTTVLSEAKERRRADAGGRH
jgi:protein SCO1/2